MKDARREDNIQQTATSKEAKATYSKLQHPKKQRQHTVDCNIQRSKDNIQQTAKSNKSVLRLGTLTAL
jgi:hypothetical protein